MTEEITPGGSRVFRHHTEERDLEATTGDAFKLDHGAEALSERFVANDVTEWMNVRRPSVVPG